MSRTIGSTVKSAAPSRMGWLLPVVAAGLLLWPSAGVAQAQVIFQHSGSTDPTTEGWTEFLPAVPGVTAGPLSPDPGFGINAWFIDDNSTAGGSTLFYVGTPTDAQIAQASALGWKLSWRLRVVDVSDPVNGVDIEYANGTKRYTAVFGSDASGNPIIRLADGTVSGGIFSGGPSFTPAGSGYHLYELVFDPVAGSADLFVDGIEVISDYPGHTSNVVAAGKRVFWAAGGSITTGQGNWSLAEFEIATAVCVAPPSGMVSWWDGDSVSGTAVSDIEDGNDGTLVNGTTTAPGVVGDAFSFDGVNDFVEIPDSASLRPVTEITIDAWVRVDSVPDGVSVHIVDRHSSEGGKAFEGYLLWAAGSGFGSSLWTANNGQVTVRGGPTNIVGTFHHVAMTYDGATVRLYVDGVQVNSASATGSITYAGTLNVNLGRNQQPSIFSRRFHGLLDEVEIYDRALSASQIQDIFTAVSAGKCKGGPPTAGDDSYATDEDTTLTVAAPGVLGNDSDPDGDTVAASLVSGPSHGGLTLNADGSFTYSPEPNFNGMDSFTYKANDGTADSNVATVTTTVNPVNDAPVADDQTGSTDEDVQVGLTLSGSDVDGDSLTFAITSPPSHGDLSGVPPALTYTPDPNFNGSDSFTFTVDDGHGGSDSGTFTFTVHPVNDAPVANDDAASAVVGTPQAIGVLANDTDIDGDALVVAVVTQGTFGSVVNNGGDVTYTADNVFGSLIVQIGALPLNNGQKNSLLAKLRAAEQSFARGNRTAGFNQLGALINELAALKRSGRLDPGLADSLIAQVLAIQSGNLVDTFTYTVGDGNGGSDTATVTVSVSW